MGGIRKKIKDADTQLFIAQLERKKDVNFGFFYDFVVDVLGKFVVYIWG
jgi:hypothetical protein